MTDDEWLDEQQRLHNLRSFGVELPAMRPVRPKRHIFTITELLAAERWLEAQESRTT